MLSAQHTYRHVKSRNVGGEPFSSTYWPLWYPSRALTNLQTGTLRCHQQWTGCIKLHSLYASLSSWPGVGSDSPRGCIGGPWQPHLSARWSVLCRCCFFSQRQIGGFCHGWNSADKSVLPLLRSYILSFHGSRKLAPDLGIHFRGSQTFDILWTRIFVQFGLELLAPHLFWQQIIKNSRQTFAKGRRGFLACC